MGVEVFGDPHSMLHHGRADVVTGIDIDAAIERNQLPCCGPIMAAGFVQGFANEMEGHFNFRVLEVR